MIKTNQKGRMRARLTALAMAFSLVVPQVAVMPSAATEESSAEAELRALISKNLVKNYDATKDQSMDIVHEVRNNNAKDALTVVAQNIKSVKTNKAAKYVLYDINKDKESEMIIGFNGKKKNTIRVYSYDTYDFSVNLLGEYTGVSEVRKDTKKKQIVVVASTGKNKKTITAYKVASEKLKAVTTYTQSGKTYKKGSKKTNKKAFDKYYKTVKKLAKVKLGSIPKEDLSYEREDETYYGNGYFWRFAEDEMGQETLFMSKENNLAFSYANDATGWHEYSTADPALTRYIFGPNTADKKTGKTYSQEDWEAMNKEYFGEKYAPTFLTETVDEKGETVLDIEADAKLNAVKVSEKDAKNGSTTYKGKEYTSEYGDAELCLLFFTEGPFKDRIAEAGIYYPHVTGNIAHDKWIFTYGTETGDPQEADLEIYNSIIGNASETRTLNIGAASDDLKQTIKTGTNVRFVLYGNGAGQFYTTAADGKETLLPLGASSDSEGNVFDLSEEDEAWVEFENKLNPANGQLTFDNVADGYLFWRAK